VQFGLSAGASGWAMEKFVTQAGEPNGPTFAQRLWVDHAVPEGQRAMILFRPNAEAFGIARDINFFNVRFQREPVVDPWKLLARMNVRTGRIHARTAPYWVIMPDTFQPLGLKGRTVAVPGYYQLTVVLQKHSRPYAARWAIGGVADDGWLDQGVRARIRSYGGCLAFNVRAASGAKRMTVRLQQGARVRRVKLTGEGAAARLVTHRPGRALLTADHAQTLTPGRRVTVQVLGIQPARCGGR